jgi:hypothetical protein
VKFAKFVLGTLKGIYDILATYFLAFILPFALAGFAFHLIFSGFADLLDYENVDAFWSAVAEWSPIGTVWLRIFLFLPLHVVLWRVTRKPREIVWPKLESIFDQLVAAFLWFTEKLPALRIFGEVLFSLVVTVLLVPFVLQPTLVPEVTEPRAWAERTANLLDGTATAEIANSVVGLYRKALVDPVVAEGVPKEDLDVFETSESDEASGPIAAPMPNGEQPLMDRWDPYIRKVSDGDASKFAYVKAFMWVESGGRQYAVSRTGCSGLMQFCVGTAKSPPFNRVFGTGTVYRCSCKNGACSIPRNVQKELESGDPEALEEHRDAFPCEMTDARFDPNKIIPAGGLYIDRLRKSYGGNIYLMYIGYNSGPRVADAVYEKLDENPDATLDQIDDHLADCLRPYFGQYADRRARGLVNTHLPKLANAYDKYYVPADESSKEMSMLSKPPIRR